MAADSNLLQGEVNADPSASKHDVEQLLRGFLDALVAEKKGVPAAMSDSGSPAESVVAAKVGA